MFSDSNNLFKICEASENLIDSHPVTAVWPYLAHQVSHHEHLSLQDVQSVVEVGVVSVEEGHDDPGYEDDDQHEGDC